MSTKKIFKRPISLGKVEMKGFPVEEISHVYEVPFKFLSLVVKMSIFQFRINHILYTERGVEGT